MVEGRLTLYSVDINREDRQRLTGGRGRMPGWAGLLSFAAVAIVVSLMFAAPARATDCGPVPEAQPPLPAGTALVWVSNAQGACILATEQYECAQASGEPC
jgi:hypothetical protein